MRNTKEKIRQEYIDKQISLSYAVMMLVTLHGMNSSEAIYYLEN